MKYRITVRSNSQNHGAPGVIMQNTEVHSNYQATHFQLLSFGFQEVNAPNSRFTFTQPPGGPSVITWMMSHPDPDHLPVALLQMKPVCKFEIEPCTTGE